MRSPPSALSRRAPTNQRKLQHYRSALHDLQTSSEEQIRERLTALVARQVQFFVHRCKRTDLNFMIDLLEQWETLTDNERILAENRTSAGPPLPKFILPP
jgi:hypothetical protein